MIADMALLKKTMEQMDAEDPIVAQAAKDRAAQTLSDAKLNFSKMAELIEQRRLLLRPRKPPLTSAWRGFLFTYSHRLLEWSLASVSRPTSE